MVITRKEWRSIYRIWKSSPDFCQWEDLQEVLNNWPKVSMKQNRKKRHLSLPQQHGSGLHCRVRSFDS